MSATMRAALVLSLAALATCIPAREEPQAVLSSHSVSDTPYSYDEPDVDVFDLAKASELAIAAGSARTLEKKIDLTPMDSLALCNDGTAAQYYYSPATDPASTHLWVIQQAGGGWCYDKASCEKRGGQNRTSNNQYHLTTNKMNPESFSAPAGSILNAVGSRFENANVIQLPYCTSDGYVGDTDTSDACIKSADGKCTDKTFQFRGRRVVTALINSLAHNFGLAAHGSQGEPPVLIYSGCSAGGRGAMHNFNRVAEQVPPRAPTRASVHAPARRVEKPPRLLPDLTCVRSSD
jgi:hypothetical protein